MKDALSKRTYMCKLLVIVSVSVSIQISVLIYRVRRGCSNIDLMTGKPPCEFVV